MCKTVCVCDSARVKSWFKGSDKPTMVGLFLAHTQEQFWPVALLLWLPVGVEPRLFGWKSIALATEPWLLLLC